MFFAQEDMMRRVVDQFGGEGGPMAEAIGEVLKAVSHSVTDVILEEEEVCLVP